jgi:nucleoside triphosphate pyrophosphatase
VPETKLETRNWKVVLASASPRRAELLRNAGIDCTVDPAHVPEDPQTGESPLDFAFRVARDKAITVARRHPDAAVLGADTVVILGHEILNKPADPEDALRMLRRLAGHTHAVTTAVCLVRDGREDKRAETTRVTMAPFSEAEARAYVATGEPMDKAGAYAIQGWASRWVTRIEGDYFNVVGLPVALVWRMLHEK